MGTRIFGGIAGWLLGVVPLVAVNAVDYFGIYYFPDPFLAGAIALVAGLLVGGVTAGVIGGRTHGGAGGAGMTGMIAAVLYAVSVIALMEAARAFDALPFAVTEHPLRVSLGILFLAALLLLVALVTGVFVGRSAELPATPTNNAAGRSQAARRASAPSAVRQPGAARYGAPPYAQPRYGDAAPPSRAAGPPRPSNPQWQSPDASDPRYAGARAYGPAASRPARRPNSNPNQR